MTTLSFVIFFDNSHSVSSYFKSVTDISIPPTHRLMLYVLEAGECVFCGKADIRNPLLLLAHERSRFATCQWELLTPTDISIPLTHRLVLYALEAGECLFCVQVVKTPVINLTSAANNRLPGKDCLTGVPLRLRIS